MKDIKERFKAIAKHKGLSVTEFEMAAGLSNGLVGKIKNPNVETILKVANRFPDISLQWLLTGNGDMEGDIREEIYEEKTSNKKEGIPFLDGEHVAAGLPSGIAEPLEQVDYIHMPNLITRPGDFAVRAKGRSMIDKEHPETSISDGTIVVVSPWTEAFMEWGEIYCIATRSGYAIKRLMESDKEGYIKCVSTNADEGYAPYDVPTNDIVSITKVTAIINLKLL